MSKSFLNALPRVFIGFIAAGSAAVVPRLVAQLTVQGANAVSLFTSEFIIIASVFALFIGIIVAIMEHGAKRLPRDTFMTALGIPALLAGALTTTDGVNKINTQQSELRALSRQVTDLADIPRNDNALEFLPIGPGASLGPSGTLDWIPGIGVAQASDGAAQTDARQWGYAVHEPRYVVVLQTAPSAKVAESRVAELKREKIDATAMKAGDKFYVTLNGAKPESEAVKEAIRIKKLKLPGVKVQLVRASR